MLPSVAPLTAEPLLTSYRSPAYLGLEESLGKEIKTGRYVENARVGFDGMPSNPSTEVLFTLSEIDGEATFVLRDEHKGEIGRMNEKDLPSTPKGSFSKAVDLVSKIKAVQSYALKSYATLSSSPLLFAIHENKRVAGKDGMPSDAGLSSIVEGGRLLEHDTRGESPELIFFSARDIAERAGLDTLEGLTGKSKYLSVQSLELPNGTREFNFIFETELYPKGAPLSKSNRISISLANIPMLRWGMPIIEQVNHYKISANPTRLRNFQWELIFPRSETVLGSADWDDLEGIQALINRMQDPEDLVMQQLLVNPEFFLS